MGAQPLDARRSRCRLSIRCNTMCAASRPQFFSMSRRYMVDASLCSYENRSRFVMNAQTVAATSNRSDATASAWIAEPVRGMSGRCLGSAGLPGSFGLSGSSGLAMDLMFTVTCVLASSWPEVRNCGSAPPSAVSVLRVAVMVTVWLTASNAFRLATACSASSICLFRACSCSASATRR